jgi:hypothetical protein
MKIVPLDLEIEATTQFKDECELNSNYLIEKIKRVEVKEILVNTTQARCEKPFSGDCEASEQFLFRHFFGDFA